jgi:predicted ATPase/DNA-binding XRE family transcriptional regulator
MNLEVDRGSFGPLLRRFRLAARMSQEELAERAKLSADSISALERGRRRAPYRETIRMISDALGLSEEGRAQLEAAAKAGRSGGAASAVSADSPPRGRAEDGGEESARNIVRPLSSFHNRHRELADLAQLLADHRLVSIVGAGGIGKTRLAIELALDLIARYPDGAWLVDLAPLDDDALVTRSVIATLRIRQVDGQADMDTLLHHLAERDALIVIDNCEHVIGQVAELTETLLRSAKNLRILTTTREPLNVLGERVYRIPSLESPAAANPLSAAEGMAFPAVTLFVDRSEAAGSAFTFSDATARHVGEICRRLDGIALAIELAASRTAVLSPYQILEQLENHFGILAGGSRTALPRHRTMRETVRWSYDRLSAPEQTLFRRCAIFVSGFTLDAVGFIAETGQPGVSTVDTLTSLVNKSLIVADDSETWTRYRLLEPIRAYGMEMLEGVGELETARSAFAQWGLAFAQVTHVEWETMSSLVWSERVEPEMDNLRAVLFWALEERHDVALAARIVATARRLWARLYPSEGKRWVLAARQALGERPDDAIAAALLLAEAQILIVLEQYSVALEAAQNYERLLTVRDEVTLAEARGFAGLALVQLGRQVEGEQLLAASIDVYRAHGCEQLRAHAVSALGIALLIRGFLDEARRRFREALTVFSNLGNERGAASMAANLAETEYYAGNIEEAVRLGADALATFKSGREARLCRLNMAAYLVRLERFDEAKHMARASILRGGFARADANVARALQHLAAIAALRPHAAGRTGGDLEAAARLAGYVDARLAASHTTREFTEQHGYDALTAALQAGLDSERLARLGDDGRTWTEDQAVTAALQI